MAKEEKKSILEDALTDFKQIQEAAEQKAAEKLSKEFPEKFNNLLKEELNNNKKSENEPYKKVNNEESNQLDESEDKNAQTKMKKQKKEETKKVTNEERDKDFMGDVENETPNKAENDDGVAYKDAPNKKSGDKGNAYKQKTSKENIANKTNVNKGTSESIKEEFDVSDLDVDNAENAIDSADANDEVVTMEEIEKEISEMEELKDNLDNEDDPIALMRNKLQEMLDGINQMEEQKQHGGKQNFKGREKGGPTNKMIDEREDYDEEQGKVPGEQDTGPDEYTDEQKQQGGKQNFKGREKGGPTTKMIDEEEPVTDDDIESVLNDDEGVDEAMGIAHSSSKHVAGDHLPGEDHAKHRHKRSGSYNNPKNESISKKYNSLLKENKKLSKKINESKKYKKTAEKLLENYKTALEKYRNQLKEMAVFNTNLSHVNNILVNESLALTQEDKIKIINDFKSVNTIGESKKQYNKVLNEMKEQKKTISESVEESVSKTVGKSSKENLVEEKTAYENDEHVNKMKSLIEYLEKDDNKKIIN